MSSANDKDSPSPPGFSTLLSFDIVRMRIDSSKGIVLPTELANRLNSARLALDDDASDPQAWDRACVYPSRADEFAKCDQTPTGKSSGPSAGSESAPGALGAAEPVQASVTGRRVPGRRVRVVDVQQFAQRRIEVGFQSKFLTSERKTEVALMDHLRARGDQRVVGLRSTWRDRISELRADMLHMSEVVDRIEACCALSVFTRQPLRIPPLLLVGPPGVGKTFLAKKLADMLGVSEFVYQLESAETTAVLTGSEKHWGNSEVGQLFKLIVQGGVHANPVVVLDELDKVPQGGGHYRPANALHAVLDPITSRQLRDKCIDFVFDASYVVYIATANDLSNIGAPLISRFEVFHINEPGPDAAFKLALSIAKQVLNEMKLTRRFRPLSDDVVRHLAALKSPRRMHKILAKALGRAVVDERNHLRAEDLDVHGVQRDAQIIPLSGSEQALRLMTVMREAVEVLGSHGEAEEWLMRPALGLDGHRPFDLMSTEEGTAMVRTLLTRMDHGVYT